MGNRMTKIKNFNQILLAIAGTIGIILLIICSGICISDIIPRGSSEEGMIVTEEAVILNEQGFRKEIISFSNLEVIDSVNQTYLLPVTQASLDNPESSDKTLGLINSFSGSGYYKELVYNNLVIHYGVKDSSVLVFDERLSIGDYMISKQGEETYILATGCDKDSNKDNLLNSKDLQDLYTFNINKVRFAKISIPENYTTLRIFQPRKADQLICRFGVDRDANGIFDSNIEPQVFMKLDLENLKLIPIVSNSNIAQLQKKLEGK